ncbi:MAG: hypothetical protein F4087_12260 [Gemmatimonadetes bacterium]|nr:hypothetical protein [Gemmatimonadota bacterium]MYJ69266.1 hypothetical protein [Gemmatimonadota bacterium]
MRWRYGEAEIREANDGPHLHGVLIQEGRAARRRREVFAPGAVRWPSDGVGILTRHHAAPEVRAVPERQADGRITLTARATAPIRAAVEAGRRFMSVEFHSLRERQTEGGIREILAALVPDVALVPDPEYAQTGAEVRGVAFTGSVRTGRAIDCKCADGEASEVEFGVDAFRGVESLDVTAIARGAESVIASTATDSLALRRASGGALSVSLSPLDTEAGRRTGELLDAGQPVYARPVWTTDDSEYEVAEGRAVVTRASFKYLLVRPVPEADAKGLDPLKREREGRAAVIRRRRLLLA